MEYIIVGFVVLILLFWALIYQALGTRVNSEYFQKIVASTEDYVKEHAILGMRSEPWYIPDKQYAESIGVAKFFLAKGGKVILLEWKTGKRFHYRVKTPNDEILVLRYIMALVIGFQKGAASFPDES